MDKYYTPDISEFYVGFEYEFLNDGRLPENDSSWSKEILTDDYYKFFEYYANNVSSDYRVKYLDQEDIEGLGYGFVTKLWGFESSDGNIIIEVEDIDDLQKGTIDIYCVQDLRFKGRIKNKSEMAKLLKQLEI